MIRSAYWFEVEQKSFNLCSKIASSYQVCAVVFLPYP